MSQEPSRRDQERQALAANADTRRFANWIDTSEAAEAMGFTEMHTKTLARSGKLRGVKIKFKGYTKWLLDPESVEGYEAKSFGPSGMRRFILRIDPERFNLQALRNYLSTTYPDGDEGDSPIYTLRRPKTSKSKSKTTSSDEPYVPNIVGYGLPPEPTEPTQEPQDDSEDDEE